MTAKAYVPGIHSCPSFVTSVVRRHVSGSFPAFPVFSLRSSSGMASGPNQCHHRGRVPLIVAIAVTMLFPILNYSFLRLTALCLANPFSSRLSTTASVTALKTNRRHLPFCHACLERLALPENNGDMQANENATTTLSEEIIAQ